MLGLLILETTSGRPYVVTQEDGDKMYAVSIDGKRLPLVLFRDERGRIKGAGRLYLILGVSEFILRAMV